MGESPSSYRDRFSAAGAPRILGCFLFIRGVAPARGVDAVMRGNSGNWLVLVEPRPYSADDFAP